MKIVLIVFTCLLFLNAKAQYLDTGAVFPVKSTPITQYKSSILDFSSLRGKLVILDFWDIGCAPCIAAMPKMEALQQQFGEKIQIILVTIDSQEKVDAAKKRIRILRDVKLPSIVGDTSIMRHFAVFSVPSHIWISPSGKIIQITDGFNSTPSAIENYLVGHQVDLQVKKEYPDFDQNVPLWLEGGGRHLDRFQYYSYITKKIDAKSGFLSAKKDPETGKITHIRAINLPLITLFAKAYAQTAYTNPYIDGSRVILDVRNKEPFIWPTEAANISKWMDKNSYCYELVVPDTLAGQVFLFFQQDLARYFRIKGEVTKQKRPCLVLRDKNKQPKYSTAGGERFSGTRALTSDKAMIRNGFVFELVNLLTDLQWKFGDKTLPVIDELNYTGKIDVELSNRPKGIQQLQQELEAFGISLVEQEREVDVLRLTDL